jgi:hypothetical protein
MKRVFALLIVITIWGSALMGQDYKIKTNYYDSEKSKVPAFFSKEVEISSIAFDGVSTYYFVTERCDTIYSFNGANWVSVKFTRPKGFEKTEVEAAVYVDDFLYLSTEGPCGMLKVSVNGGEAKEIKIGQEISKACSTTKDGANGLEGIAYKGGGVFYLALERTADGKSAIIFRGELVKANNVDTLENVKSWKLQLESPFRYSDIYLRDTMLYLLRTKVGGYFIDTISIANLESGKQPKAMLKISESIIGSLKEGKFNTNLEGIVIHKDGDIALVSDDADSGSCDAMNKKGKTAFLTLRWDTIKPAPKPEAKKGEEDPRASLTIDCLSDVVYCDSSACKLGNNDPFCGYKMIWNPFTNCHKIIKGTCDTCAGECLRCGQDTCLRKDILKKYKTKIDNAKKEVENYRSEARTAKDDEDFYNDAVEIGLIDNEISPNEVNLLRARRDSLKAISDSSTIKKDTAYAQMMRDSVEKDTAEVQLQRMVASSTATQSQIDSLTTIRATTRAHLVRTSLVTDTIQRVFNGDTAAKNNLQRRLDNYGVEANIISSKISKKRFEKNTAKAALYQRKVDRYMQEAKVPCKKACSREYKSVPVGEPLMLELSGVNPYKYDLSIKGEAISTSNIQAFELLMQYLPNIGGQFPEFQSGLKAFENTASPPSGSAKAAKKDPCKLCKDRLKKLNTAFNQDTIYNAKISLLKRFKDSLAIAIADCNNNVCMKELDSLKALDKLVDVLIEIEDSLEQYNSLGKGIDSLKDKFVCLYQSLLNDNNSTCFHMMIVGLRGARAGIKSDILLMRQIQKIVLAKYTALIVTYSDFKIPLRDRRTALESTFAANNVAFDSLGIRLSRIVLDFPESYLRFVIPEVDGLTDYIDVTAGVKLKEGVKSITTYSSDPEKFKISIPTCKGVHFAFGSGVVATGFSQAQYGLFNDSLFGQSPSTGKDTLLSAGKRLERLSDKNRSKDLNIGIGFQAFISYRTRNYCYVGATLGVAYSSDNTVSLLVGPSFLAGKKVKLGISCGMAVSTYKTPKGNYTLGDTKGSRSAEFVNYKDDNITYDTRFRPNWFASITLDFGSFTAKTKK